MDERLSVALPSCYAVVTYAKENVPAEEEEAKDNTRIPRPLTECCRETRPRAPAHERARPPLGVARMVPRELRLTRENFARVARSGVLSHSDHFSVRKISAASARRGFSVVVSKKIARTAPARNRVRRRVYDALLRISSTAHVSAIVYAKRGAPTLSFSATVRELGSHFRP